MAEGGDFDFNIDEPIKPTSDDAREKLNTTQPFRPGQASTPYHGSEQIPLQTTPQREESGLPSYEETTFSTPLLGDFLQKEDQNKKIDDTFALIKKFYPEADFKKIDPIGLSKKGTRTEVVTFGSQGGESKITKNGGKELQKSFTRKFFEALGPSAEQLLKEGQDKIKEQSQRLAEAEKQQREAEKIAAERDKELQEMENLKQQTERTQARIDSLQEEHGSNLEREAELRRLKQLKKNHQTEYEKKKKEVAGLEKQAKNKQKV